MTDHDADPAPEGGRRRTGEPVADGTVATRRPHHSSETHPSEIHQKWSAPPNQAGGPARSGRVYDDLPVGLLRLDSSGTILEANRLAAETIGVDRASLLGMPLSRFTDEAGRRSLEDHRREVFSTDDRKSVALRLHRPDGEVRSVHLDSMAFRDEAGERVECHSVLLDLSELRSPREVSERLEAEGRLRQSESRFREIAENIRDVFYVRERKNNLSYVSPAYEAIWGRPVTEVYEDARRWLDALHPDDVDRVRTAFGRLVMGGPPFDEVYRVCRSDGSVRWVRDRAFSVAGVDGELLRFIGVVQDVTAERELERELRQAQKMEAVGTLASGIAHDFGNLLQAIIGCVQMAMRETTPPERARTYLEGAEAAARRGARLTQQITSFGRKRESEPRAVLIDSVIRGSVDLLQRLVGQHIEVAVETGAPEGYVIADPVQLEHILMNLAANARDAMPTGGTMAIRTRVERLDALQAQQFGLGSEGEFVRLEVRDTGVGMDERTQERIFEPFYTTKAVGKGTGLGLSTVFANTRKLDGHVAVESQCGAGTMFVLHFPRRETGEPARQKQSCDEVSLDGRRVLLVEDEPLVRLTIRVYLEELGMTVLECERAVQALDRLAQCPDAPVDVLVTDVVMPELTGRQLADRLRHERPDLPVLYVSAHAEHELIERGMIEAGAPVLGKPFDREQLARQLRCLIAPSALRDAPPKNEASLDAGESARPETRAEARPSMAVRREAACKVLLVEASEVARTAIEEHLSTQGYDVFATDRPKRALDWLADRGAVVDLLLTELHPPEMAGEELAARVRNTSPDLRVIFMAHREVAEEDVPETLLHKPIALFSLSEAIARLLSDDQDTPAASGG